ncbi:phage holin family protein [Nocardioides houyundeii]|uniref:phage holin family protein n=1 Tax=Nocardioides houyundeii TaxID=2045452 RepID=UPI0018EF8A60|nr:phage holin family protein [Nocardioides houyundeii]
MSVTGGPGDPVHPTPDPLHSTDPLHQGGTLPPTETRSLGDIIGDITAGLSNLIKQEMELARTEIKQEVSTLGKGAGLLGGAGVAGHLMLLFLSLAVVYLLDNWMPTELAALIVAIVWGVAAAVLGARGRKEIKEADPQLPKTQQTLKEDVQWAKAQKS